MLSGKTILLIALFAIINSLYAQDFKETQMQNGRVLKAYEVKEVIMRALLEANDLDLLSLQIFIRAFKHENMMEVWGRDSLHEQFVLLKEYRICRISGEAGPKRKQGDRQIPEGCYHIDRFNPWSQFHLSMGINYPNESDRILSDKSHPGGEIFIHGSCVTIGCLPMTDDRIKEIYILAVEAANNGQQNIPVHIFPCKMIGEYYAGLKEKSAEDQNMIDFWNNLEEAYLYFEMNNVLPAFTVDKEGRYCFL